MDAATVISYLRSIRTPPTSHPLSLSLSLYLEVCLVAVPAALLGDDDDVLPDLLGVVAE